MFKIVADLLPEQLFCMLWPCLNGAFALQPTHPTRQRTRPRLYKEQATCLKALDTRLLYVGEAVVKMQMEAILS